MNIYHVTLTMCDGKVYSTEIMAYDISKALHSLGISINEKVIAVTIKLSE